MRYEIFQIQENGNKWIYFNGYVKHRKQFMFELEQALQLEQNGQDLIVEVFEVKTPLLGKAKRKQYYYEHDIAKFLKNFNQLLLFV